MYIYIVQTNDNKVVRAKTKWIVQKAVKKCFEKIYNFM